MHFATTGSRALLLALLALLCSAAAARAATVTEFSDGISQDSRPFGITAGPDGNMWFTEADGDQIGRITPTGAVTEFEITAGSGPTGITSGPDGNLWFTEYAAGRIGRITPAGVVTEFSAGITPGSSPRDIVTGADGNLWYTDDNGRRIGRITPAGVVTEFSVDTGSGGGPSAITAGADGNLWFTQFANPVGRMTPAGVLTRFPSVWSGQGIAAAPDGSLWTTEYVGPIRRMTTAGVLTRTFALPPYVSPYGIAATADGNMWFADTLYDSVGRVTPSGAVALVIGGITPGSQPQDIAVGPDGNLWFTESVSDQIGRVTPTIDPPLVAAADATAITTTSATLNGTIDASGLDTEARFEWGPTTAYGNQTVVQDVDSSSALPLSAAVANLQPATTYHCRLIATNGAGTVQSGDRTFTTAANFLPPRPACSNGIDDDRDGFADRDDPRCHSDADRRNAGTYRPLTATEAPVDNPVLACSPGGLALVSVELGSDRRIRLRGVADPSQAGRRVGIHAKGRRVASARVQADGSFAASFGAGGRAAALGRYQARLGTRRSQSVAAQRRLANIVLRGTSGTVKLTGRTVGRRPRSVELLGRAGGCGSFKRLATVRVGATGRFTLSAAAYGDVDIATYRVRIAAGGAAGQRESTPPRAVALR